MYLNMDDSRAPLPAGASVTLADGGSYVIDSYAGSGGFALTYIAHEAGGQRYVAMKELFPRRLENAEVRRRADGRIVISNPIASPDTEERELWTGLLDHFRREVELSRRAGWLTDEDGDRVRQNDPDALAVRGPFQGDNGNYYLLLDTYHGQSLWEYINGGWASAEDRGRYLNSRLEEIVDILIKAALQLARLHRDRRLLHLDLSPSNIYVTLRNAGTALEPYLIDYGSACELGDPAALAAHHFTCNPFSAPEIRALAELDDPDSGYQADPSSDTYALCAILLYALTGARPADFPTAGSWKALIGQLLPPDIYQSSGGTEGGLAGSLTALLEKGLAASQASRFSTADGLCRALQQVRRGLGRMGILSRMDQDELLTSLALERYPLYEYAPEGAQLSLLCLGTGALTTQFVLSAMSCGQMLEGGLHIHIAAPEVQKYKSALLRRCPALRLYSNLTAGPSAGYEYVTITFTDLPALDGSTDLEGLLSACPPARYVVVSQGSNTASLALAQAAAVQLARRWAGARCVVHYDTRADAAASIPASGWEGPAHVELVPMGRLSPTYLKTAQALGMRAFQVHYLYEKLSNPKLSRSAALREFVGGRNAAYSQRASAASAVHIKYKLYSLGIRPGEDQAEMVRQYQKKLKANRSRLMDLEHRRWLMYMVASGYTFPGRKTEEGELLPDMQRIDSYSFRESREGFVDSFHSTALKLHPCMVPCGEGEELSREKAFWDGFQSFEEIYRSALQPLERISLSLHLLAARRIESPAFARRLEAVVRDKLGDKLGPAMAGSPELKEAYRAFAQWCQELPRRRETSGYAAQQALLLQAVERWAGQVSIRHELEQLRDELAIIDEFARYKDYRAADGTIVDHLGWVLCGGGRVTLVKLRAGETVSGIAAPLVMEPEQVIYYGYPRDERLSAFFQRHGGNTAVSFAQPRGGSYAELAEELRGLRRRLRRPIVIDMTGADGLACAAAIKAAEGDRDIGVVRFRMDQGRVENIANFPLAAAYTLPVALSVEEAYLLHGAEETTPSVSYLYQLKESMPALWAFYQAYRDRWDMVSDFFLIFGRPRAELYRPELTLDEHTQWSDFSCEVAGGLLERTGLEQSLRELEGAGVLRALSLLPGRGVTEVNFRCPEELCRPFSALLNSLPELPFTCQLKAGSGGGMCLRISSETRVTIADTAEYENRETGKKHAMSQMKQALEELGRSRLLYKLRLGQPGGRLSFVYASNAVHDVFEKAGNILEAYVWEQAVSTGFFDDVRPNFMFRWPEGEVSNELDVIASKGLSTLVISCKTAKCSKEHLYEVKYLVDRFSINSKAVLVCTSDRGVVDGRVTRDTQALRARAAAMGIYLIGRTVLDRGELGGTLVKIAKGELSPGDLPV